MQFEGQIERIEVVRIPMRTRFRGIDVREAALLLGPEGWGEFSPFLEYGPEEASAWLAAALEQATLPFPEPARVRIPINATIPVVSPERAYTLARSFGATTAKVKVSDASCAHSDDLARVAAVREALGDEARIRVDANASWEVNEAIEKIRELDRAAGGLEYVEQPCASVRELAEVRRGVHVKIAADESVRKAEDPLAVARAMAADILVMKAQPLGEYGAPLRSRSKRDCRLSCRARSKRRSASALASRSQRPFLSSSTRAGLARRDSSTGTCASARS